MRVLLINCPTPEFVNNKEFVMPPSILYLAGALDAYGIDVRIFDLNISRKQDKPDDPALLIEMMRVKPDVVGIGCLFSGQFSEALKIASFIKTFSNDIKVIVGGIHPTLFGDEIIRNIPDIDYVCLGEGEATLLSLATGWMPLNDGIVYRTKKHSVVHHTKHYFIQDLDKLPLPAYHLINFEDYYQDLSHWHNPKGLEFKVNIPILSSRSCPRACNFCSMKFVMGKGIRFRSPENVVNELELLYTKYGCNRFAFQDDNLTLSKAHITGICNEIIKRGLDIQWEVNNGLMVKTLTSDVLDLMVKAGMVRAFLAIESGNDNIRNNIMGKNLPRKDIYRVAKYLKKNHPQVFVRGLFIMGMPEDTPETLDDTYNMIKELPLDTFSISNIMPFPGTEVFNQAVKDNLLINVSTKNMWKESRMDYNDNKIFYIKPYNMTVKQLQDYRKRFDELKANYV